MVRWTPEQYAKFAKGHAKVAEALRKPHPRPSSKTGPKTKARVPAYSCPGCGVSWDTAKVQQHAASAKVKRFKCDCVPRYIHIRVGTGPWRRERVQERGYKSKEDEHGNT